MGETVYVDLFFMVNFSMDFLCLYITSRILSRRTSTARTLMAAVIGGIYADLALFFPFGRIVCLLLDVIACVLICALAFFERRGARQMPLLTLVFVAVSMALGGFMTALFNLFNRSSLFDGAGETEGDGISVWLFALLAAISAAITLFGGRFFRRKMSQRSAEVDITYGTRRVRLRAMADSGNMLREPISALPCIIVDLSAVKEILPYEIVRMARSRDLGKGDALCDVHKRRIRLIPTETAAGSGVLIGVRMEKITILTDGKEYEVEAIVALSELGESADGYRALIPTCLLIG